MNGTLSIPFWSYVIVLFSGAWHLLSVNIETILQWLDIKVLLIYALEIDAFGEHGDHLEY